MLKAKRFRKKMVAPVRRVMYSMPKQAMAAHDTPRILRVWGGEGEGWGRCGVPCGELLMVCF